MPRKNKLALHPDRSQLPLIENEPSLQEWLDAHHAIALWEHDGAEDHRHVPMYHVAGYRIGAGVAIVVVRPYGHGWDVFTAGNSIDIDQTLADAESRLGL